jgi:hypothetical protein
VDSNLPSKSPVTPSLRQTRQQAVSAPNPPPPHVSPLAHSGSSKASRPLGIRADLIAGKARFDTFNCHRTLVSSSPARRSARNRISAHRSHSAPTNRQASSRRFILRSG